MPPVKKKINHVSQESKDNHTDPEIGRGIFEVGNGKFPKDA